MAVFSKDHYCEWCGDYVPQGKGLLVSIPYITNKKLINKKGFLVCCLKCEKELLENNADQIASVNKHRESEEYKVALEKRKEEEKREAEREAEERKIRAEKKRQEEEQEREEREREQERREQQKAEEKKKRVISILAHIVAFIVNPCFIFISGNGYCILFSIIYSIVFLITSFKDYYEKGQYEGKNISNLKHLVIYSIIGLIAFIAIHCFL